MKAKIRGTVTERTYLSDLSPEAVLIRLQQMTEEDIQVDVNTVNSDSTTFALNFQNSNVSGEIQRWEGTETRIILIENIPGSVKKKRSKSADKGCAAFGFLISLCATPIYFYDAISSLLENNFDDGLHHVVACGFMFLLFIGMFISLMSSPSKKNVNSDFLFQKLIADLELRTDDTATTI